MRTTTAVLFLITRIGFVGNSLINNNYDRNWCRCLGNVSIAGSCERLPPQEWKRCFLPRTTEFRLSSRCNLKRQRSMTASRIIAANSTSLNCAISSLKKAQISPRCDVGGGAYWWNSQISEVPSSGVTGRALYASQTSSKLSMAWRMNLRYFANCSSQVFSSRSVVVCVGSAYNCLQMPISNIKRQICNIIGVVTRLILLERHKKRETRALVD